MPLDFQGQFTATISPNFQQRVAAAMRAVAVMVYTEVNTTPGHATRAAYALEVVQNPPLSMVTMSIFGSPQGPDRLVYAWTSLLAAQGLDNTSSDSAIQTQIQADWNAMAGV